MMYKAGRTTRQRSRLFAVAAFFVALILFFAFITPSARAASTVPASLNAPSPFSSSYATYYHNSAYAGYTLVHAIDVSYANTVTDWNAVKKAGVDYVLIRAGHRFSQSGIVEGDDKFVANITGAKAAGLKVGLYFFSQAITTGEAKEEARFLINQAKGYQIDLLNHLSHLRGPAPGTFPASGCCPRR